MASDRPGPVDLPRVIEQAIEKISALLGDRPVSVVAAYPAHLPALDGDPDRLVDILEGLIAGTVERTQHGEVGVRAALSSRLPDRVDKQARPSEAGPWAIISIAPRGNGLTAQTLQALLAERTPSRAGGLAGVDCRRELESMGGELWVESDLEEPELRLALPLRAALSPATDVSSLRRSLVKHLPKDGSPVRRLLTLVEDPELSETLATELSGAGYQVINAQDGDEVLALARREAPDLILLDILAREPTAFEVAMVLKQDARVARIPVLFMTSVGDPDAGMRMSAVDFVVRPTGTGALVAAIEAALHAVPAPVTRVMVVEPSDALRETMVVMIQAHGYRVTEATGAEEALVLAERVQPGLVLVNAGLAQDRDYWLLRGLRQLSTEMPVFVLAEVMSEAEGRAAVRRGASGFTDTGKLPDLLSRVRGGGVTS
ncbi:MAG TPA: response regulator [Anaerolineales bacterium]|nr:response regulator [Anaerolineales bacterium]